MNPSRVPLPLVQCTEGARPPRSGDGSVRIGARISTRPRFTNVQEQRGRALLPLPGSLPPARPASRGQRPVHHRPADPWKRHLRIRAPCIRPSRPPAPAAVRTPAGRPAGPPGLPLSRPARHAGGTPQEQQSSLHATLHVISDAGGRDCDCDHTPDSTKPREEGRPGGRGQPARPTGGARCSSLRTRHAVPQAAEATF